MAGKVWLSGCTSYFSTPAGKVVTQLPYSGGRYWLRTRIFPTWRHRRERRRRRAEALVVALDGGSGG
jgi:hypothetical protein